MIELLCDPLVGSVLIVVYGDKSIWRRGIANWPAVSHLQLSTPSADLSDRSSILVKLLGSDARTKSTGCLVDISVQCT